MAHGRLCSKRRCTGLPGLVRCRLRSSATGPTPAGTSSGRGSLTEAHWLRDKGFAVLVLMRRGRGKSEGITARKFRA